MGCSRRVPLLLAATALTTTALAALGACTGGSGTAPSEPGAATVTEVVDGDTIKVEIGGHEETIRLVGVRLTPLVRCNSQQMSGQGHEGAPASQVLVSEVVEGAGVVGVHGVWSRSPGRSVDAALGLTDVGPVPLLPVSSACGAGPPTSALASRLGVLVRVTVRTDHGRRTGSLLASEVLGVADRHQMRWVATQPNSAEVVDDEAVGDRADQQLVGGAVCAGLLPIRLDPAISVPIDETRPDPAGAEERRPTRERAGLVDLRPQSIAQCHQGIVPTWCDS